MAEQAKQITPKDPKATRATTDDDRDATESKASGEAKSDRKPTRVTQRYGGV